MWEMWKELQVYDDVFIHEHEYKGVIFIPIQPEMLYPIPPARIFKRKTDHQQQLKTVLSQ